MTPHRPAPLVSILMATYNRANLIHRAIRSVLAQTFLDWELIIIDDGSSDHTFEIVNPYIAQHNIRYLKHSNRRQPRSLNTAIRLAEGQYITFLDSDDEYSPQHLDSRVEYLAAHPHLDLIHGGIDIIGEEYVPDKHDLGKMIHLRECVCGGTIFGKATVLRDLGGFADLAYAADSDLIDRAIAAHVPLAQIDIRTYRYYRDVPDAQTRLIVG